MTEQMPINQAATEQRLVEELTGTTPPLEEPAQRDLVQAGDPEPIDDDHSTTD
ncbi:hypothetical protein [Tessaracoccus antarcticus]|uniref:hypothetical protein n=1 Tax=Tessaracoccus antarcticus TaxID=2479848 RepID=UPI001314B76B|nr:hypothetical protein [Tessaracoccus antarcticus]